MKALIFTVFLVLFLSACGGGGKDNEPPAAVFTAIPTSGTVPLDVSFDASASSDMDGSIESYAWDFGDGESGAGVNADHTYASAGTYTVTLTVTDNDDETASAEETITVNEPANQSPTATFTAVPTSGDVPLTVNFDASASSDSDGDIATYVWNFGDGESGSGKTTSHTFNTPGTYVVSLTVTDDDGAKDNHSVEISVAGPGNQAPSAAFTATPTSGEAPLDVHFDASASSDPDGTIAQYSWNFGDGQTGSGVTADNTYASAGDYTATLTITDNDGATASVNTIIHVSTAPPPDPVTKATTVNKTVATSLFDATAFLYSGSEPIQTGVDPADIDPDLVAILRGKVSDKNGQALSGVGISILKHPEYGQTATRVDGVFDISVNGGTTLVVSLVKEGYLSAQRTIKVPNKDYTWLPDVILTQVDSKVTSVAMQAGQMQVARANPVTDSSGTRTATLLIPQGTSAELVFADGTTQAANTLNIRATEYSQGDDGPLMMPAELPPTSGYTYAVEISADEAINAGASDVRFNQTLYNYVEDIVGFPVGTPVPSGYYDRNQGQWIPSDNGIVMKILGAAGGLALIDSDGDDVADDAGRLNELNFTSEERQQLALLYTAGTILWRVPITHFTPWDHNWPYGPPADAEGPDQPEPDPDKTEEDPCEGEGSIIECQNQVLGERIPVAGTPFSLNYRSNRQLGFTDAYSVHVPVSGDSIPGSVKGINVDFMVAGQKHSQSYPPGVAQSTDFIWDGKDAYGRDILGAQPLSVGIGYVYDAVYYEPAEFEQAFGAPGGDVIQGVQARNEVIIWQNYMRRIGPLDARTAGLGGWTLDTHHVYDPASEILYLGDGRKRKAPSLDVYGYGLEYYLGFCASQGLPPGTPPVDVCPTIIPPGIFIIWDMVTAPDGSTYFLEGGLGVEFSPVGKVHRLAPDGTLSVFAGGGNPLDGLGDGGLATDAQLGISIFGGLALGPDSSLYITHLEEIAPFDYVGRIRRVSPTGIINTVAGGGTPADDIGDGGPATQAKLLYPTKLAVGSEGSVYISDKDQKRIRRVGPDGVISTVMDNEGVDVGDGGPVTDANFRDEPGALAIGPDDSLYFIDGDTVRRISSDNIVNTVAGADPSPSALGDTGFAVMASLDNPKDIAISSDGLLYIADFDNHRVRVVNSAGIITTIAGGGSCEPIQLGCENITAKEALIEPTLVSIGQDGDLFVGDNFFYLHKLTSQASGVMYTIASEDARELYRFNNDGRHAETLNAANGATLRQFNYDVDGWLSSIVDGDGNTTTIHRNASGEPTSIEGPYGHVTDLLVDANGYLSQISNPDSNVYQLDYANGGLLQELIDPESNTFSYSYYDNGRLKKATDPAGGFTELARTDISNGYEVTKTTAENRISKYKVERLANGDRRLTNTLPEGVSNVFLKKADGTYTMTQADGTEISWLEGPDPRWGMHAPVATQFTANTPGGINYVVNTSRTAVFDPVDPLNLQSIQVVQNFNGDPESYVSNYDAATKTLTVTTPEGRESTYIYDEQGRVTSVQLGSFNAYDFHFDTNGRVDQIKRGPRIMDIAYDAKGNIDCITNPLNDSVCYAYTNAGLLDIVDLPDTNAFPNTTDLGFNGNQQLDSFTTPSNQQHTFDYSPVGELQEYNPPNVAGIANDTTTYDYNLDRQLDNITRPGSVSVDYQYDTEGRIRVIDLPGPRGDITYYYQASDSQIDHVTSPDGIDVAHTYDGFLLTSESWTGDVAGSVSLGYDDRFGIASTKVNGANEIIFQTDMDGLVTGAGNLGITRGATTGFVESTVLGNITTDPEYNDFGEEESFNAKHNTAVLYSVTNAYDDLGRVATKTETIGGATTEYDYTYDELGRLTQVEEDNTTITESYGYDANGNRVLDGAVVPTYDAQDRLTAYDALSFSYTGNGEMLTKKDSAQASPTTYTYDALGNLINVVLPDGTNIQYLIDGLNRRVGKKVGGIMTQGFLYRENRIIAELNGSNFLVSRFVYASGHDTPDFMIKGGNTYRLIKDHIGSVRLVVKVDDGTIAQRLDYDSFGRVLQDTNPGFQPFGFSAGHYDHQTGLVRFGARDYDASIGRWTAKDPVRFLGGDSNLYAYAKNDPVNHKDMLGLQATTSGGTTTITINLSQPAAPSWVDPGYVYSGYRVRLNGETVEDKRVGKKAPKECSLKIETHTLVENHVLVGDIVVTHYWAPPQIIVTAVNR